MLSIDLNQRTVRKLKFIAKYENCAVENLIEKAVKEFVSKNIETYEDRILLKLMLEAKNEGLSTEKAFFKALKS